MFNFNKNVYSEICFFDMYGGCGGVSYDLNYNIIVTIENGPIKKFFYKDGINSSDERKDFVKEKVEKYIYDLYKRNCIIDISKLENIKENDSKLEGQELLLNDNSFVLKK